MPRRVIDLPEKLSVFRKLMKVSATGFKDKLEDKGFNRRKAADWEHLDQSGHSIQLREPSRTQVRGLLQDYGIVIDDDCFFEPWEGLARRLGLTEEQIEAIRQEHRLPPVAPDPTPRNSHHNGLSAMAGIYQLIRPHTLEPETFILEVLQIGSHKPYTIKSYSHNILKYLGSAPPSDLMYSGEPLIAPRYSFTLMSRTHEINGGEKAYRCIGFYRGPQAPDDRLSGVMLRGLSEGIQAVGVPFLAVLAQRDGDIEKSATFVSVKPGRPQLARVSDDIPVFIGEASKDQEPDLFAHCKSLFDQFVRANKKDNVNNHLVLHTLDPKRLRRLNGLGWVGKT